MNLDTELKEWWTGTLLKESRSAHPVFGTKVRVSVKEGVVRLLGEVETADEADELEREARCMDTVKGVVNDLTVINDNQRYHMQTVAGIFADRDTATLASRALGERTFHPGKGATILTSPGEARRALRRAAKAARAPVEATDELVRAVQRGKVVLVDRVPEDDALRIIAELEGSRAEAVRTLPPEPNALVED